MSHPKHNQTCHALTCFGRGNIFAPQICLTLIGMSVQWEGDMKTGDESEKKVHVRVNFTASLHFLSPLHHLVAQLLSLPPPQTAEFSIQLSTVAHLAKQFHSTAT